MKIINKSNRLRASQPLFVGEIPYQTIMFQTNQTLSLIKAQAQSAQFKN